MSLIATVIIPTSIDRGPCLRLAVESVLRQTVSELEVFIIGDGVAEITRETALELVRADPRVRFFDHPKHPRRGEPYRHQALQEARGRIVCYLCDRDLYLPWHIEELARLLTDAEIAHAALMRIDQDQSYCLKPAFAYDLQNPADRMRFVQRPGTIPIPLSFGAHTLEAYRRLPEGWAVTPPDHYTDCWFWTKFLQQPDFRTVSGFRHSVLYFPRGSHPGCSTDQRLTELESWSARIQSPSSLRKIEIEMNQVVYHEWIKAINCQQKTETELQSLTAKCRPWYKKLYQRFRSKRI